MKYPSLKHLFPLCLLGFALVGTAKASIISVPDFVGENTERTALSALPTDTSDVARRLDSPVTVFSQPGVRFMHKLRAADPAARITVDALPEGLTYNAARRTVEGTVRKAGSYTYKVNVDYGGRRSTHDVGFTVSDSLPLPVPFLGWISWNSVQSEVSEDIVRQVVDLFQQKGLSDAGWNTIMLDDWWHADERAADGRPQPNAQRFPHGIEGVSRLVNDAGMRFGIYTDAAEQTCAGAFGSLGYEDIDARQYAAWNVEIVKCDYCNAPEDAATAKARYKRIADAFRRAGGRTMLYACEWGVRAPWTWGAEVGSVCWRTSYDVRDCWRGRPGGIGVLQSIEVMKDLSAWSGVNRFNDADMLCTGLHGTGKSSSDLCATGPGMSQDEYRTQFALWCMWSSPMALSFDPRSSALTDDDFRLMTTTELLALNQDLMGQQADLVSEADSLIVFAKDLENGDVALSVTNLSEQARTARIPFASVGGLQPDAAYAVRDLWRGETLPIPVRSALTATVAPHATSVFRLARTASDRTHVAAHRPDEFSVKVKGDKMHIVLPQTDGQSVRLTVTDDRGHIVQVLSTTKKSARIAVGKGTFFVRAVVDAQCLTRRVTVR